MMCNPKHCSSGIYYCNIPNYFTSQAIWKTVFAYILKDMIYYKQSASEENKHIFKVI